LLRLLVLRFLVPPFLLAVATPVAFGSVDASFSGAVASAFSVICSAFGTAVAVDAAFGSAAAPASVSVIGTVAVDAAFGSAAAPASVSVIGTVAVDAAVDSVAGTVSGAVAGAVTVDAAAGTVSVIGTVFGAIASVAVASTVVEFCLSLMCVNNVNNALAELMSSSMFASGAVIGPDADSSLGSVTGTDDAIDSCPDADSSLGACPVAALADSSLFTGTGDAITDASGFGVCSDILLF
jgi:hypothetical protein